MSNLVCCAVHNKAYDRIEGCYVSPTVGLMIRDNAPFLAKVSPHFEEDLELVEIGSFEGSTFYSCEPIVHSWNEYKHPEKEIEHKE